MRAWLLTVVVLCACGRINFDPRDDGAGTGDGMVDVSGPQPSALLFYYALEDDPNVGGGADDSSGNNRLAPCLNPNPCPLLWDLDDFRGTSRICDFEDGTLRVSHDAMLGAIDASFTLSLWVKVDNPGGCLVAMPGSWKVCATVAGTATLTILPAGSTAGAMLPLEWNHVAVVWTGTLATIYSNGGVGGTVGGAVAAPTMGAVIAASDVAGTAERLDGWMDDIRLYRTALSDTEIAALFQQGH